MKHSKTYTAALAHDNEEDSLEQEPESVSRSKTKSGYASLGGSGADTIPAPDTIDEEYALYEDTGFVSAAIHQYADDVTMSGARITAESDETKEWLEEEFLPQAGIVGGQRHQSFSQLLYQDVIQYLAAGNILDENVKDHEDRITGFLNINPATCKASTLPNKPVLWSPEDHQRSDFDGETTDRGEAAAFLQYHSDSPLGRKGMFDDKEVIPLSLNDVTFRPRTPKAGEIWGVPITRNIKQELTEFKNIRKDLSRAIRTKAWGIWSVSFDTEVIETKDEVMIDGWEPEEMDEFTEGVGSLDPGEIVGHDGTIDFEKHEGEVPEEVLDVLGTYVKMIVAALPPPLYAVGFEDNINQFVVKEQESIYEASVESMRTTLEETWTPTLRKVCEDHGYDPSGVELELEPPDDESPIRNMELDDLEKFALFADGLSSMFGQDAYRAFKPDQFADLVAQLPQDTLKEEAFVGVPGGVPSGIQSLSILEQIQEEGSIDMDKLADLRAGMDAATEPGDVAEPTSTNIDPFSEERGSGENNPFGDNDDQQQPDRGPDGTFDGSN